jgi:tRNA-2-methylthio-N6-dimethylallyladenosine synthase
MRGCDKFCTFCIVPYVRGRERSLPLETIVKDVELLAQEGFKEVTLLGQTVNSYHDGKHDFSDLLAALVKVDGIQRIRFTSPHPSDVTDKQIETMTKYDRICKHIHLPLQSGSDRILKLMRRSYSVGEYLSIVEKLRNAMPNIGITTDVIVGFCSETEEEFQETYNLMKNVRYDSAFMFKYSPREGTIAHRKFADDVSEEEKLRRLSQIIALQEKISLEVNRAFIGKTVEVLVEGESKKGSNQFFGKTDDFKTAVFPKENVKIGDIVKVKVSDVTSHTLFGKIV